MGTELPDLSLFPKRLKEAMDRKGLSQSDLARVVKTDRSTVHRWLGGALPEMDRIRAIADALDCSPRWLIGMSESDNPDLADELRRLRQRVADLTKENERLAEVERRVAEAVRGADRRRR